jgi:hypothetical protein
LVGLSDADEARLAEIKRVGRARRNERHRRNAALAALTVVVVVGGLGVPVMTGKDGARPQAEGRPEAARQADAGAKCRNSTDPSCGPFRWTRSPGRDARLRVGLDLSHTSLRIGQEANGVVTWSDRDAARADLLSICWGDAPCEPPAPPCGGERATGSWSPPPRRSGHGKFRIGHSYSAAGTHTVSVVVRSHSWPADLCPNAAIDPYSDTVTKTAVVTVA